MQSRIGSTVLRAGFAIFAAVLFVTTARGTDHQTVLYNFGNDMDGVGPSGGLITDSVGNFYGVTAQGGYTSCLFGCGTAFELSPTPGGGWTETVLHNFGGGNDGILPVGGLVMDRRGNLFGVTTQGGIQGDGTIFELSPDGMGGWTETVLYSFRTNSDEAFPSGGLTMDAEGNLYGTAESGGSFGAGTVFELSPSSGGTWTETTLHSFASGDDGASPIGGLIMDSSGNLYGTTYGGGPGGVFCQGDGCGTVFELSPGASGWTETVLDSFNGDDGAAIWAGVVMDRAGNLYGTAYQGGNLSGDNCAPFGCGTVFELSPSGGGWTETTLHTFDGQPDTGYPQTPLILDSAGNLYGTGTGTSFVPATVFELSPRQGGWLESLLSSFNPNNGPTSGVVMDRFGQLYGEAGGGLYGGGIGYRLTPPFIRPASRAH
jgi:uncharacterized repeat protein (TIGR03803 family)